MTPRCLECRRSFNRQTSLSKLWCPECEEAKANLEKPKEPPGRTLTDQLKDHERRKKKNGKH